MNSASTGDRQTREDVLDGFLYSQEFENLCNAYGISPYSTGASPEPTTIFNYPPVDLEKGAYISPMGGMSGAHVTPIDHQYYVAYDFSNGDGAIDIDVYSPGDGVVTQIQHMNVAAADSPIAVDDFRIVIQHTSTISSIYIHIDELSDKLAAFDPGLGGYASVNVEVSAGEVIGRYGGSVDYNIVDTDIVLNFINPDTISVSIGTFNGTAKQFSVKDNRPDPATISGGFS